MRAEIITKRFVACPECKTHHFSVEHLFDRAERTFGPWLCETEDCLTEISGTAHHDGSITLREEARKRKPRGFALMQLRDIYLVLEQRYGRIENPDYFYHSHQCPTNLLRSVVEVYGPSGEHDQHGMIRYVASIDDTPETRAALHDKNGCSPSRKDIFELFKTDGTPPATDWPAEDEGVIPYIAEMRREQQRNNS